MDSQKEMTKAIKHAGKYMQKEQDKIMPPIEYCPDCLSILRKSNDECKNHYKNYLKYMEIPQQIHHISMTKKKGKYEVRCYGDYSDIMIGKITKYEFSRVFNKFGEARRYARENVNEIIKSYKKYDKKAHVLYVEEV